MKRVVSAITAASLIFICASGICEEKDNKPMQQFIEDTDNSLSDLWQNLHDEGNRLVEVNPDYDRPVWVEGISVDQTAVQMVPASETTVKANIMPSDASVQKVVWTSSDPDIVEATGNGPAVSLKAVKWGQATISGRTEDGNYTCSFSVNVGNEDSVLKIEYICLSRNHEEIRIRVTNQSDKIVKRFTYIIAGQGAVITKNGASWFEGNYTLHLLPGESTKHNLYNFSNYKHGNNDKLARLTIWLTSYTLADGTVYTYDEDNRPKAVWNLH